MSTLLQKLSELAHSPQGKKLTDKAQEFADDPKTKEQVEKAKLKLAEMREGGSTGAGRRRARRTRPEGRLTPSRGAPAAASAPRSAGAPGAPAATLHR